jgi:hypothetical protein
MKNQIKLLLVGLAISMGVFACKGSIDSGDAGTARPMDSLKTGSDQHDMHQDTSGDRTHGIVDTTKKDTSVKM